MIGRTALTLLLALAAVITVKPDPTHKHLLLVLDGLRPDYVTSDVMPRYLRVAVRT